MQYSIVRKSEVEEILDCRMDAEYWHPAFIENSKLVSRDARIRDFVRPNISNIKSSPIHRDFEYLEISRISLSNCAYETTKVPFGEEPDRAHYILQKGDVAVSTVRPNRNAIAFVRENGIVGSSGLSVLRSKNIESEYLLAFCKTNYFVQCLMRANKASMYPAVSNADVLDTPLFVPSNSFRLFVAETVQNSVSHLDSAQHNYKQAEEILLSELGLVDWRPKHCLSFVRNYSDTKHAGRMDAEYFQPKYEEIIHAIQSYPGGYDTLGNLVAIQKCVEVGSGEYLDAGVPFVRVSNLSPFEITEEKYISSTLYNTLQKHQPQRGEILLTKDATPGMAYYMREQPPKMILSSGILRLKRKTDKINDDYLMLTINSILTRQQVARDVGGSVILHWRPEQVKGTVIPILAEDKQIQIRQRVAEAFALRRRSKHLLEYAKRAVEIAIEQDEQTALAWLKSQTK